jgi:hypothetical protein
MTMEQDELERVIDRRLRELPAPRAPRTLLPRVMAAVADARRPWYARGWRSWPLGWRTAAALGCVAGVAAAALSMPLLQAAVAAQSAPLFSRVTTDIWHLVARTVDAQRAAEVVWRVVINPVASVVLVPVLAMLVASLACGAALGRLAFGGTPQS